MARMRTNILQLILPLAGIAMLAGTLVWGAWMGDFPAWLLGMSATSIAVMLLGLFWQERGPMQESLSSLAYSFFVLVACVCAYLIVGNHSRTIDITSARRHTLSPQTISYLNRLGAQIRVVAFVEPSRQKELNDFFALYREQSPLVEFRVFDPAADVQVARQFGDNVLAGDAFAISMKDGKERRTRFALGGMDSRRENVLTNALLKAERGNDAKIYFTRGRGERPLKKPANLRDNSIDDSLSELNALISEQVMPTEEINLQTAAKIPDDAAVVVLASPTIDLLDAEREVLTDYLDEGGSLLVLYDPQLTRGERRNMDAVLAHAGIASPNRVLIDPSPGSPVKTMVFAAPAGDHPIVQGSSTAILRLNFARPFEMQPDISPKSPEVAPLLVTGVNVWSEDPEQLQMTRRTVKPEDAAAIHSFVVGAASAYPTPNGARGNMARVVVFGDADFITNQFQTNEALTLAMQSMNWLSERDDRLQIPPRLLAPSALNLTAARYWTMLGTLLVTGLAILVGGVSFAMARRRMG